MSLIKSFGALSMQTRTFVSRKTLHPKKFTSILDKVPAKPRSAWQVYFRENMGKIKENGEKLDVGSVSKKLSASWKVLSDQEKSTYQQMFEKESKVHYDSLEKALNNATPKQFKEENLLRKKYNLAPLRDPKQPKRPKNSFLFYLEHLRAVNDPALIDFETKEQSTEAAKKYRALSPSELKIYNDQAKAALEKYHAENAEYQQLLK